MANSKERADLSREQGGSGEGKRRNVDYRIQANRTVKRE